MFFTNYFNERIQNKFYKKKYELRHKNNDSNSTEWSICLNLGGGVMLCTQKFVLLRKLQHVLEVGQYK